MQPIKWGIVSTAKIGLEKVVPAMLASPDCDVVAVASRDQGRAQAAATHRSLWFMPRLDSQQIGMAICSLANMISLVFGGLTKLPVKSLS